MDRVLTGSGQAALGEGKAAMGEGKAALGERQGDLGYTCPVGPQWWFSSFGMLLEEIL